MIKKIKELFHSSIMRFSFLNKLHHDRYWGRLLGHIKMNSINDLIEEWNDLFEFEAYYPSHYKCIYNEKVIEADFNTFIKYKYEHLITYLNKNQEIDTIVELGSGWGRNLIYLRNMYPNHKFIACEPSKSGREITDLFSKKYGLDITTIKFSFLKWDKLSKFFRNLKNNKVLILTSFSIEQVKLLDDRLFYELLSNLDNLKAYHIEPVLFQINGNKYPFNEFYNKHYNSNLVSILDSLKNENLIEVTDKKQSKFRFNVNETARQSAIITWSKKA